MNKLSLVIDSPQKKITTAGLNNSAIPLRVYSLDALRGVSILMMVFSAAIPFGVLPDWMYHAQVPPPDHIFNPDLPGITWVDLIFPFFLFTMGAAIPLAISNKLKTGFSIRKIIISLFNRSILLAVFAIYIFHINPSVINPKPEWGTWLLSLLGFALLFPVFSRFPKAALMNTLIRLSGSFLLILFLFVLHFFFGRRFSVYQSDIIILVLANVAFFGGLIWIFSRNNLILRISFMGILIALRLSSGATGWIQNLSAISPVPWLFDFNYLQYLFIIIPGTIIGDLILEFKGIYNNPNESTEQMSKSHLLIPASLLVIINIVVVIGLKVRVGFSIFPLVLILIYLSWFYIKKSFSSGNLFSKIFFWGVYWLILGLLFEPYEGGIKKDHPTLSYYFVTSGLAVFILLVFHSFIDILRKKKFFNLFIECGQNPLIAYAAINNLVYPLLALLQIDIILELISIQIWFRIVKAAIITFLVALSARIFTKLNIYLRA